MDELTEAKERIEQLERRLSESENGIAPKPIYYTTKMRRVEATLGGTFPDVLPRLITERGLSKTAEHLGISKATLGYWLLKFRIQVHRVALGPFDVLEIRRGGKA